MQKRWLITANILFACLLLLIFFRLWQVLSQPENLFRLCHYLFLVLMIAATVYAASAFFNKEGNAAETKPGSASSIEAWALLGVSFLILAAFFMAGWAAVLARQPAAEMIPWTAGTGHVLQSFLCGMAFCGLLWLTHLFLRRAAPNRDPWLLPLAGFLTGAGLVLLFVLGPDIASLRQRTDFNFLFRRQLRSFMVSLLVFICAVRFFTHSRIESLTRKRYVFALLSMILICLTAVLGVESNGRKLAVNLGIMQFQTVELVKILALFFMVGYFRYEMGFLDAGQGRFKLPRTRYHLPYLLMWAITLLPIFIQKDLGPTALIFTLFLAVFYLGTGSWVSVVAGGVLMAGMGGLLYYLGIPSMVRTRIDMWLNPFGYSQNVAEALWAFAAGGAWGAGTGMGMGYHIPVVQSDFNFAALAEQWGLTGSACVLTSYVLLICRIFRLSRQSAEGYNQLLLAGIGSFWAIQTFIIVGGNLDLLPLTGITLPFVSYGGSSLLVNFMALGIVVKGSDAEREMTTILMP